MQFLSESGEGGSDWPNCVRLLVKLHTRQSIGETGPEMKYSNVRTRMHTHTHAIQ